MKTFRRSFKTGVTLSLVSLSICLSLSGCRLGCGVNAEAVPTAPVVTETTVYPAPTPVPPVYAYQPQLAK